MANEGIKVGDIAVTPDNKQLVWTGQAWAAPNTQQAITALRESASLDPNKLESIGAGMADVYYGARQLLGLEGVDPAFGRTTEEALQDREVFDRNASGWDQAARVGGQFIATAPIGVASAPASLTGRAAMGALAGGSTGGVLLAEDGGERLTNAVAGAVGGGVGGAVIPPVLNAVGRMTGRALQGFRRVWGAMSPQIKTTIDLQIDDAARSLELDPRYINSSIRDALRRTAMSMSSGEGEMTPQMMQRQLRAQMAGFVDDAAPTRGQVSRIGAEFGDERNLAKMPGGEQLAQRFERQGEVMRQQVEGLRPGVRAEDAFDAGEAASRAVQRRSNQMQQGVRRAYETAHRSYGDGAELSVNAFRNRMGSVLADFEDEISPGVKRRIAELSDGTRKFTPMELEKLDKKISGSVGSTAPKNEQMAASLLKRQLVRVWGDSGYAEAKRMASQRFRALGNRNSVANRVLADRIEPEQVIQTMTNGSIRNLRSLQRLIGNEPEWAHLQDAVLQKIISKSFRNSGDELSAGSFRPATFERLVEDMGPRRLSIIFGDDGARQLLRLARVSNDLFSLPAGHTASLSNTPIVQGRAILSLLRMAVNAISPGTTIPIGSGGRRASATAVSQALRPETLGAAPNALPRPVQAALGRAAPAVIGGEGLAAGVSQATRNDAR